MSIETTPLPTHSAAGAVPGGRPPWIWPVRIVTVLMSLSILGLGTATVVQAFATREHVSTAVVHEPVQTIQVSTGAGDITVTAGTPGSPVTVRTTVTDVFRNGTKSQTVRDGVLNLAGDCPGYWV